MRASIYAGSLSLVNKGGCPSVRALKAAGQESRGFLLAALMGEMMDHTQMAGQGDRLPNPGISYRAGVVRLPVRLFFLTKVHSFIDLCLCHM